MLNEKIILFLLRVSMGWIFLYSGITKILDPTWSAEGFIRNAGTFYFLYQYFLNPQIIGFITEINRWGQLLLGISLIIGLGMNISTVLGAILMMLYYFAALRFPFAGERNLIIDEHIIFALSLLTLRVFDAGSAYGLKSKIFSFLFIHKHRTLAFLLR